MAAEIGLAVPICHFAPNFQLTEEVTTNITIELPYRYYDEVTATKMGGAPRSKDLTISVIISNGTIH